MKDTFEVLGAAGTVFVFAWGAWEIVLSPLLRAVF